MDKLPLLISAGHPAFRGHFPGRPIVPGVVLLDHAQRVIEATYGITVSGLAVGKFHSPVGPGEPLMLHIETSPSGIRFEIFCPERKIADGRFTVTASQTP